jgi:hypothetical protein
VIGRAAPLLVLTAAVGACGGEAACADYVDAVDACLDALEAATGVDVTDARPDPDACPGDDDAATWACRADAYAASACDGPDALTEVAVALAGCASP